MMPPLWIKLLLAFWRTTSCCCFLVLSFAPDVVLGFLPCTSFMGPSSSTLFHQKTNPKQSWHSSSSLFMVRNIDLPECLLFYGVSERFFAHYDTDGSLTSLLQECADVDTAVVVIPDTQEVDTDKLSNTLASFPVPITLIPPTHPAPNPHDLYYALNGLEIQPRPFGGSAGFGAKQYADPPRNPLPARTVVVCHSRDQSLAARYNGMRVVAVPQEPAPEHDDSDMTNNELADALVDHIDFYLDDIATPGSFWLNPPPGTRDEEGNQIDVLEMMEYYYQQEQQNPNTNTHDNKNAATTVDDATSAADASDIASDEMSDEELKRILADMDSL